jgi:hypothetical protein
MLGPRALGFEDPQGRAEDGVGIEREAVDPEADEELREAGVVARRLAADPDRTSRGVRALDRERDDVAHGGIPLVEEGRELSGVAVARIRRGARRPRPLRVLGEDRSDEAPDPGGSAFRGILPHLC